MCLCVCVCVCVCLAQCSNGSECVRVSQLCQAGGHVCEICGSEAPVFAFDIVGAVQCRECNGVFHKRFAALLRLAVPFMCVSRKHVRARVDGATAQLLLEGRLPEVCARAQSPKKCTCAYDDSVMYFCDVVWATAVVPRCCICGRECWTG